MKNTPSKMPHNAPEDAEGYLPTTLRPIAGLHLVCNPKLRLGLWNQATQTDGVVGAANIFTVIQDNWVQVSPLGDFWNVGPSRNGRPQYPNGILQRIDGQAVQAMVDEFNSVRAKVGRLFGGRAWYIGHPDGDPANWSDKSAYGWIMALENRGSDGLWAQVKWTEQGEKLKESGAYKYFSPYWFGPEKSLFTENGKTIMRPNFLKSVGFVNDPNIPVMPLVNSTATAPVLDLASLSEAERKQLRVDLANYGTSEGARKGWETRRGNAAARQKAAATVAARTKAAKTKSAKEKKKAPANKSSIPKPPTQAQMNAPKPSAPLPAADPTLPKPPPAVAAAVAAKKPGLFSKIVDAFKHPHRHDGGAV